MKKLILALSLLISAQAWAQYYPWGWMSWKEPVLNVASLPAGGNTPGDARVSEDTYNIYVWNGSMWVDQSGSGPVVPGGANGDVQFNNAGTFGGNAGFTYSSPGSISLTNGGGNSVIQSNGNGLSSLVLNDTSGSGQDSIALNNSGSNLYTIGTTEGFPLSIYDGTTLRSFMTWDSSDNLTATGNITSGDGSNGGTITAFGADPQIILNNNSGAGQGSLQFQSNGTAEYAFVSNFGGSNFSLFDVTGSGVTTLTIDPMDNYSFNGGLLPTAQAETYTFTGFGSSEIIMHDNSGGNNDQLYWDNLFALYSGNGGYFTLQDLTTGAQMMAWDTSDNLTVPASITINNASSGSQLSINVNGTAEINLNDTSGAGDDDLEFLNNGTAMFDFLTGAGYGVYLALTDDTTGRVPLQWDTSDNLTMSNDLTVNGNINANGGGQMGGTFSIYGSGGTLNFSSNSINWLSYNQGDTTLNLTGNVIFGGGTFSVDGGDITTDGNGNLTINNEGTQSSATLSEITQNIPGIVLKYASGIGYADIQTQSNVGAVTDLYIGPGAPQGSGRWTLWDDITSTAMIDFDASDNLTAGANITATGAITTLSGIMMITPQANGSTPATSTDGAAALTTGAGPTFAHILCVYNGQVAVPGWFRASDGVTPCTF